MRIAAGLVRKVGLLHKMLDAASSGELKYSKVLSYIDSQCVEDETRSDAEVDEEDDGDDAGSQWSTPRNSNLQERKKKSLSRIVPSDNLRKELWYDSQGHSLLRKAVLKSAPFKLLVKLCELCPEAALVEDSKGRLVLHHACRLPVTDQTETILMLILQTHVLGLIHRDHGGRTPLHYLFWYHAPQRSTDIVKAFCARIRKTKFYALRQQDSDTKCNLPSLPGIPTPNASHTVPNTAAIIPDAQHGCLPLHYAVMEGASLEAITILIQAYPLSKHVVDRYGQSPLHWYLGGHYLSRNSHVSGCDRDPNALPWYQNKLSPEVVRLLSSSRVARTADYQGRTPLHWAASFWAHAYHYSAIGSQNGREECPLSISTAKLVLDHHVAALGQRDGQQQTPLMVLFQTTYQLQLSCKAPHVPPHFSPPFVCVQLLLEGAISESPADSEKVNKSVELSRSKRKGYVTAMEDASGDLPLHAALQTGAPVGVVQTILEGHPGALLHGNDQSRVPLHSAFGSMQSAQLQHPDVVNLMLSKCVLDGRLALKMEDSQGLFPIHLACQNNASHEALQAFVRAYPKTTLLQSSNGALPLHAVVSPHLLVSALSLGKSAVDQLREEDDFEDEDSSPFSRERETVVQMRQDRQRRFVTEMRQRQLRAIEETRDKLVTLIGPILKSEKASFYLSMSDEEGYLPLHLVALFGADYSTMLRVLRACPGAALKLTHDGRSVLDLHEQKLFQKDWKEIRQLLFSFAPTLESHRHRVELLTQCVSIVVAEVGAMSIHGCQKQSSFHWRKEQELKEEKVEETLDLQLSRTLSTTLEAVQSVLSHQASLAKAASQASRQNSQTFTAAMQKGKRFRHKGRASRGAKSFELLASLSDGPASSPKSHSKYDEGETKLNYVVSETEYEDDESYFSDQDDEEEEYLTEDDQNQSEDDTTTQNMDSTTADVPTNTFSTELDATKSTELQLKATHSTLEEIFMSAKLKAMKIDEEKKDDIEARSREEIASLGVATTSSSKSLIAPACSSDDSILCYAFRPDWFSEVGIRLWAFFALYRDPDNPSDNYSTQVTSIFNEVEYDCVESLVLLPLPECARMYFPDTPSKDLTRLTFREAANPKCRELMHRMCFFIGTYEFQCDEGTDVAVSRSDNGDSIVVKAYEWIFTTEEVTDAAIPGVSEATIWKSGEVPAEVGLTFRSLRRPVRIQFTKRPDIYHSEVCSRLRAGVAIENCAFGPVNHTMPLLNHYDANDQSRKENRMYLSDTQDGRFSQLQLLKGGFAGLQNTVSLSEFPFALVYPDIGTHSLREIQAKFGFGDATGLRAVCFEMGLSLKQFHENGVVHTSVSLANVVLSKPPDDPVASENRKWIMAGLSHSLMVPKSLAGAVTSQGYGAFTTGTLPPEMFAKLSPTELRVYRRYWESVESHFGIKVEKVAVDPIVDMATGSIYVVKCHFLPHTEETSTVAHDLPQLPYDVIEASPSMDLWAFGALLFHLCAGRPLFGIDDRTGNLLAYREVFHWNSERAQEMVCEYISDFVAQDILLRLLAPHETRKADTMERILQHPFFSGDTSTLSKLIEMRQMETSAHHRRLQTKQMEISEVSHLAERTTALSCWDFGMLRQIHHSPTSIMMRLVPPQPWRQEGSLLPFPCAILVLPYQMNAIDNDSQNCQSRSNTWIDYGTSILRFHKAVYFTSLLKKKPELLHRIDTSTSTCSVEELMQRLGLNTEDYAEVKTTLVDLAAKNVFQFRENPMVVALKMVQQYIRNLSDHFTSQGAFLYLMDEFYGVAVENEHVPICVPALIESEAFKNSLSVMHLCILYVRGLTGDLTGMLKLLAPRNAKSSEGTVPPSWQAASAGLVHALDDAAFTDQLQVMQEALSEMYSCKYRVAYDDLAFWREFLYEHDPKRTFGDMRRVLASGLSLWTSNEGALEIGEASRLVQFRDILDRMSK